MNDILVLYPRPHKKVKYEHSDCNIIDCLQERKPLSTLEEIEEFEKQLPDIGKAEVGFGSSVLKKDGTTITSNFYLLPKRIESFK